jgi:hypothetical protein
MNFLQNQIYMTTHDGGKALEQLIDIETEHRRGRIEPFPFII